MEAAEQIKTALEFKGMNTENLTFSFLGEGAWHRAYLFSTKEYHSMVIRFPKPFSYGKPFIYNEKELLAEYGGRGLYYEQANKCSEGICPDFFTFHVQPELSFTIESYSGPTLSLNEINRQQANRLGRQCGDLFRAMNEVKLPMNGFGFLEWDNGELRGEIQENFQEFWKKDTEENWSQFDQLLQSGIKLDVNKVKGKLEEILKFRLRRVPKLALTNRDVSPENIVVMANHLRLIDPLPLYYDGDVFAGNLLNNFNTLFSSYHRSPRYQKHQFNRYQDQLSGFAEGFLDGYVQGDQELYYSVKAEEYLMLLDLAYHHITMLDKEFDEELVLRVGDRNAVEERIPDYIRKLEEFII